ncbi:hypothetical protein [Streptomyces xanthii]|nr:hypothetical protein [Streptomyces xanthii]
MSGLLDTLPSGLDRLTSEAAPGTELAATPMPAMLTDVVTERTKP